MKRFVILFFALLLMCSGANAQRFMDNLGRGLVAVKLNDDGNDTGTLVSWRRLGTEYYDVKYNLYYNNQLLVENLDNTNYVHTHSITGTEQYQVAAVVGGVEQPKCDAVTVWPGWQMYRNSDRYVGGYMDIPLAKVYDRNGQDVTSHYDPNDAEFADLDGDGELEMIIKRLNTVDAANVYPQSNTTEFVVIDAYDIDWQHGGATLMWRIDCGPNMVSLNSTEINVIAFDWDQDGKAEVVLRGADNMIVYGSNGTTRLYTIGDMTVNTRNTFDPANGAQYAWTHEGAEYLIYMNGQTGALYQWTTYPLLRLEYYNTLSAEWGGRGYGHNSSKYFFGAPYLDGHTPSLFMARGIYGTHKMIAMNLDKTTHQWSQRWRWMCNDTGSQWYGQGYHNFVIADVDEDGRDEIVYGSMVIDDNGKGLHTTGFGHGDAQHVSDFNPWRKGLEFFGCIEDAPYYGSDYRDATTGEVLYKFTHTDDDGRALMANFSNNYPGCYGRSSAGAEFSSVTNQLISGITETLDAGRLNFRIYWDGDLLSEWQDAAGTRDGYITIDKPGRGRIFNAANTRKVDGVTEYYNTAISNNDTKHNTCFQGDIIGDWREEFVARSYDSVNEVYNVRIYSSGNYSEHSLPTLWHDHQYRQAMVWQMMAYNQPPHLSYFVGEMEGYTVAPPPLMTNGREVVGNGTNIDASYNGKHVLHNEYANTELSMSGGSPAVLTINVPAWVQGNDNNNNISTTTYTCNLTGGAMSGETRFVKQGNGILSMSNAVHTNTGETTIWGGTVNFDGTMQGSLVSMKRLTTLNTTGGTFNAGMTMEYGATLNIGGTVMGNSSRVTISELTMNYGARVVLDVNGTEDADHDWLNATILYIDDSKVGIDAWENYGPEDIVPIFKVNMTSTLGEGRYPIGHVTTINGDLSRVKVLSDAIPSDKLSLVHVDGILYLQVSNVATAVEATIEITGMEEFTNVNTSYPSALPSDYYLPVVSIVANNTSGHTPTLTGTFTALDGTVTNLGGGEEVVLFSENYENTSSVSGWTAHTDVNLSIASGDATHGKYFLLDLGSTNTRYAYKRFSSVDVSNGCSYSLECDFALKSGNRDPNEFCVMSKGGTNPTNYWDNYAAINNNANMLFDLTASGTSTTYNVNGTTTTTTLASETWYHLTLNVNQSARTVSWQISNGSSGTFDLPSGTSSEFDGFYVVAGRNYSKVMLDNIVIKSLPEDLSSFTFPEPGTLQVTSSVEGYASGIKTFEVKYPYYKYYGKDFDEITGANIAEVLGNNWNTIAQNTRWANWNKANGDIYPAYWVVNNSSPINLFNDSEPQVVWMDSNGSYPAAVIEGYGVGRNSNGAGATIHVENCGDSNTLIYYLVDNSRGYTPSTYGGFDEADSDGGFILSMDANYTLAKLYIYVPVSIHDELAANLPLETTDGNVHLYRTKLTTASSWSTMVVPFDMTYEQAQEVFGEGVVIANLKENEGDAMNVYFETASKEIHANEPFLIQNVTKEAPYLVMGITSEAVEEPVLQTANFQFIGRYTKPEGGKIIFNTDDYFFDANTGLLSTVKADGTGIKMNGYRAYFHAYNSNSAKNIGLMFIGTNGIGEALPATLTKQSATVYDLSGRKVMKGNAESAKTLLCPGVYIVNGQKVVIK